MKSIGTMSIGIKAPIIKAGDNLEKIVVDSVLSAVKENGLTINDRDIVAVTEAVVGKSQKNFATIDQIAKDIHNKFGDETVGVLFPILSRNRFLTLLKGIAKGAKKIVIQLSFPSDEVGNSLIDPGLIYESNINLYSDVLTAEEFYARFGKSEHPFTGMDYIELYREACGGNCEIILANKPDAILKYTPYVINADIHTRKRTKALLLRKGAKKVFSLDEILTESVDGSGYNPEYGILGSNVSTDTSVKLFPRDGEKFAASLAKAFKEATGKNIECLIYGDGAFKDPVAGIWELADPVVSPGFTPGLAGTPNELKLKYISDNDIGNLRGDDAKNAIIDLIKKKDQNLKTNNCSLGTTPRRYVDLIGSLCDLTSGSGEGNSIVLIKNYFENYSITESRRENRGGVMYARRYRKPFCKGFHFFSALAVHHGDFFLLGNL